MNSRWRTRLSSLIFVLLVGAVVHLAWDLTSLREYVMTAIPPDPLAYIALEPPPSDEWAEIHQNIGSTNLHSGGEMPEAIPKKHKEGTLAGIKTKYEANSRESENIAVRTEDKIRTADDNILAPKPAVGLNKTIESVAYKISESSSSDILPTTPADNKDPTAWLLNNPNIIVYTSTSSDVLPAYFDTSASDMTSQYEMYHNLTRVIMDKRAARVREQCKVKSSHLTKSIHFYYYFPQMDTTWCPSFKAGSTNWKQFFCKTYKSDVYYARLKYPDEPYCHINALGGFTVEASRDKSRWRSGVKTSVTFATARHPYERLISVYSNKFKNCESDMYTNGKTQAILKLFRQVDPGLSQNQKAQYLGAARQECLKPVAKRTLDPHNPYMTPLGITFREFIQGITNDFRTGVGPDSHWVTTAAGCDFCIIDYNVVEKFETLERDHYYLLKTLGEEARYPDIEGAHLNQSGNSKEQLEAYFMTLDEKLLWSLYAMYKDDLDLFGYHPHYRVTKNPYD